MQLLIKLVSLLLQAVIDSDRFANAYILCILEALIISLYKNDLKWKKVCLMKPSAVYVFTFYFNLKIKLCIYL